MPDRTTASDGTAAPAGTTGLVYGMGLDALVEPDWPPLALGEAEIVLRGYPDLGGAEAVLWRSPRPLSSTAKVTTLGGQTVIVKRLHQSLRTPEALAEEHAFMDHLRSGGTARIGPSPVPSVFRDEDGRSAVARGEFVYEVQQVGVGEDRYQGVFSWSPYLSLHQARAAGRALAELHVAAVGHDAHRRDPGPLTSCFSIFAGDDPAQRMHELAEKRPGLGIFLAERDWRADIERVHRPAHERLLPLLNGLEPLWTHNDWHGTNLLWQGDGPESHVSAVFDFGLADRTIAVHDVAMAIERCAVDWISVRDGGPANVQYAQVEALLDGYETVRELAAPERRALPELFPLVHAEYELSEIDYFMSCTPGATPDENRRENAEIAYRDYFLGHTAWTEAAEGKSLLGLLRSRR